MLAFKLDGETHFHAGVSSAHIGGTAMHLALRRSFANALNVGCNLLWGVGGIIDLQAINGNLPSQFIKQIDIVAGISISSSGMGEKTDRSAAMSRVHDGCHLVGRPEETCIRDQSSCRRLSGSIASFF